MKSSAEVENIERVANMKWEGISKVELGLFGDTWETIKRKHHIVSWICSS